MQQQTSFHVVSHRSNVTHDICGGSNSYRFLKSRVANAVGNVTEDSEIREGHITAIINFVRDGVRSQRVSNVQQRHVVDDFPNNATQDSPKRLTLRDPVWH